MLTIPWTRTKNNSNAATLVQVSRLELKRARDVPGFLVAALRIRHITLRSPGAVGVSIRAEPLLRTFWTLSAWESEDAIRAFVRSDYHRSVMAKYRDRMTGAHFNTWSEVDTTMRPFSWDDAHRRYETAQQQRQ